MVRETSGLGAKQRRPTIHANSSPGSRGSNRHCEPQLLGRLDFRVSAGKHEEDPKNDSTYLKPCSRPANQPWTL